MNTYIGTKIIKAEPMTSTEFYKAFEPNKTIPEDHEEGYHVVYPNDYDSWSPKHVFESAYREVTADEKNLLIL